MAIQVEYLSAGVVIRRGPGAQLGPGRGYGSKKLPHLPERRVFAGVPSNNQNGNWSCPGFVDGARLSDYATTGCRCS